MPFVPVTIQNNWEYLTFHVGPEKIDEAKGGTAMARWPDGSIHIARFIAVQYRTSYWDHGHRQEVTGHKLVIDAQHRGAPIQIPLQAVEIDPATLEQ